MKVSQKKANSYQHSIVRGSGGQIVIEYVLLLVVGVAVATLITSQMVSRSPNSPGFLIQKWLAIIKVIGSDTADDLEPVN